MPGSETVLFVCSKNDNRVGIFFLHLSVEYVTILCREYSCLLYTNTEKHLYFLTDTNNKMVDYGRKY